MTNIIRPNFGGRGRETEATQAVRAEDEHRLLHVYGTAAGYIVALLEDTRGPEGRALKVVIGPDSENTIEAVAVMPVTDEGRVDADATGMAVLRAMEIIELSSAARPT